MASDRFAQNKSEGEYEEELIAMETRARDQEKGPDIYARLVNENTLRMHPER
jgi:hypothetical protein